MDISSLLAFGEHLIVTLCAGVIVDLMLRRKKVSRANEEVQQDVHKVIASQDPDNIPRINSIISSVARRHHLSEQKLNKVDSFIDEAITTILDDPFVPLKQRQEYCAFAEQIRKNHAKAPITVTKPWIPVGERKEIGLILAGAVLGAMFLSFLGTHISATNITLDKDAIRKIVWVAAIAIIVPALLLWFLDLYQEASDSGTKHVGRRTIKKIANDLKGKGTRR